MHSQAGESWRKLLRHIRDWSNLNHSLSLDSTVIAVLFTVDARFLDARLLTTFSSFVLLTFTVSASTAFSSFSSFVSSATPDDDPFFPVAGVPFFTDSLLWSWSFFTRWSRRIFFFNVIDVLTRCNRRIIMRRATS